MFISNDSIKFMIAKIFFSLAEFKLYKIKNDISYNYHGKDTLEINYVLSGEGTIKINDEAYDLKENNYFVIPEFVPYTIISKKELELYSIYFLIDEKSGYEEYKPYLKQVFINEDKQDIASLLKTIHNELITKKLGYNEIVTSSFKSIFIKIIRNENIKGRRISSWPLDSLQFSIDKIFSNEYNTITIVKLAEKLNMSVRELQRYLLKNYNKSFSDLKKNFKIEYAKIKLLYYDDSVEKISDDLNFSSREHFCYFFKKETGYTPLAFRKNKKMD